MFHSIFGYFKFKKLLQKTQKSIKISSMTSNLFVICKTILRRCWLWFPHRYLSAKQKMLLYLIM